MKAILLYNLDFIESLKILGQLGPTILISYDVFAGWQQFKNQTVTKWLYEQAYKNIIWFPVSNRLLMTINTDVDKY